MINVECHVDQDRYNCCPSQNVEPEFLTSPLDIESPGEVVSAGSQHHPKPATESPEEET